MISIIKTPNAEAVVKKLLKSLSINVDHGAIAAELEKHPDYPSLLAISDVLANFSIQNSAFRVETENVVNVPHPFIAHTNLEYGDFVVVDKIDDKIVIVSGDKWSRHKMTLEEFKKIFAGVVLTVEPSEAPAPTKTFATTLSGLKTPAITIGAALVFFSALIFHSTYFTNIAWQSVLLAVFKTAGLITSVLLLIQSIDTNNPLVQVLCKTQGKTNCNAILSSKAAKVFEGLSWSEVGFFYFAGTWLLLLFGGGSTAVWRVMAILNFISLPYTVYSIYYQARVAKQWCTLCCTVQALLWLEFFALITTFSKPLLPAMTWALLTTLLVCLLTPVIFWLIIKPFLLKLQQLQPLKNQLRRFKYNTELFNKLLNEQPKLVQPEEEWCIVLGNPEACNIITMVSNPYCPPCSKTHKLLDDLLEQRDDLQARIVFTANNSENDIKTPISRHLVALNEFEDKELVKQALNDWYEQKQKNYETWAKAYPVALNGVEYHKIDKQNAWCQLAEVTATPTLLLNGYRLPDLYQLPDLKYMLE